MKSPSIYFIFVKAVGVAGFLMNSGCAPPPSILRVGINSWPGYEFLYLAQEKGFYRDEGLEVRLVEFNSLSDCRRAYELGRIDAMGTTIIEVSLVRDHSPRSPQVVYLLDCSKGADVILAQPGFNKTADLRGARIGVEPASLGIYMLARGLELSGLTLKDVDAVALDQISMEQAFRDGQLDAIVTYPPTSVKLLRDAKARTVFSTAEIPSEVLDVIAVDADVIKERSGDVAKFLRGFHRACAYTKTNPADAYAIMGAREGISAREFAESLTQGTEIASMSDQSDYLRKGGKLSGVIADAEKLLRRIGQIKGRDRRDEIANDAFIVKESRP